MISMLPISILLSLCFGLSLPLGILYISEGEAPIQWKILSVLMIWVTSLTLSIWTLTLSDMSNFWICLSIWIGSATIGFLLSTGISGMIKGTFISLIHYGKKESDIKD